MKKLIYILFLFSITANATGFCEIYGDERTTYEKGHFGRFTFEQWQSFSDAVKEALYLDSAAMFAGFSAYGITGDDIADDTSEIQSAVDGDDILINDISPTAIFKISGTIDIDQNRTHTIDWNGATIKATTTDRIFNIDKRAYSGTNTTMDDLVMNGNDIARWGFYMYSRVTLTNVRGTALVGNSSSAFRFEMYDDPGAYGDWVLDNCDADNIETNTNDGVVGNGDGTANGYVVWWREVPTTATNIIVRNSTVHDIWGEDAQCIATFSGSLNMDGTLGTLRWENVTAYNSQRRIVKAFCGNQTWINPIIRSAASDNPNIVNNAVPTVGMFVVGAQSGAAGAGNFIIDGGLFSGPEGDINNALDKRVIIQSDAGKTTGFVQFSNCIFEGTDGRNPIGLAITRQISDVDICNNEFRANNEIYNYSSGGTNSVSGDLRISTTNTYVEASPLSGLTDYAYTQPTFSCAPLGTTPTCSDGIQNGDETGIDCGGSCGSCASTSTIRRAGLGGGLKVSGGQIYVGNASITETIKGVSTFYDDFENGEAVWEANGEYEAGGATLASSAIVTEPSALSGTHVLRLRADDTQTPTFSQVNTFRYNTFDTIDDVVFEFHFKLPQIVDLQDNFESYFNFWQVKGISSSPFRNDPLWSIGIDNRGGKGAGNPNYLTLKYHGNQWPELGEAQYLVTELVPTDISVDVWHKVTIRYKKDPTNGTIQLYQNDVLTHSISGVVTYPDAYVEYIDESINNYGSGRTSLDAGGTPTGLGYSDVLIDNYGIYVYDGEEPVDLGIPNELWPVGNVTSAGTEEGTSIALWTSHNGRVDITSESSDPQDGSYNLKVTTTEVAHFGTRAYTAITGLTSGETYVLDFYARTNNPDHANVFTNNNVGGSQVTDITSTDFQNYKHEFTMDSNTQTQCRLNPFDSSADGAIGDYIELDNVRLYVKP